MQNLQCHRPNARIELVASLLTAHCLGAGKPFVEYSTSPSVEVMIGSDFTNNYHQQLGNSTSLLALLIARLQRIHRF